MHNLPTEPQHDAHVREHELYLQEGEEYRRNDLLMRHHDAIVRLSSFIRLEVHKGVMTVVLDSFQASMNADEETAQRLMLEGTNLPADAARVERRFTPAPKEAQTELFT